MTPRQVLDRVVMRLAGLDAPPAVEREFVPKFIEYAGGARWLVGEEKSLPVKAKNASPRSRNEQDLIRPRAVPTPLGAMPSDSHQSTSAEAGETILSSRQRGSHDE